MVTQQQQQRRPQVDALSKWRKLHHFGQQSVEGPAQSTTAPRTWRTMLCSQPAAWTTNRSHLVASRVKGFPGSPINSESTLPRTAHLDSGVIGCHQCIASHSGNFQASPDMRPTPLTSSRIHAPHPTHHNHDKLQTCINCD